MLSTTSSPSDCSNEPAKTPTEHTSCPCGSGHTYETCCKPYHEKQTVPETPEQMMRSRYTAFVLGLVDYIIATTHRQSESYSKATAFWREQLRRYCKQTEFVGLEVLSASPVTPQSTQGTVHFIASLKLDPITKPETVTRQEEHSQFLKVGGRWLFC